MYDMSLRMVHSNYNQPVASKRRRPTTTVQLTDAARQALDAAIVDRIALGIDARGLQTELINEAIIRFGERQG